MANLILFGTGDIAKLAHYYFTHDSAHEVVAFCVDAAYRTVPEFLGLPVVSFEDVAHHYPPATHHMFIALSYARMNQLRAAKYAEAKARGYTLVSYLSSHATCLTQFPIGDNCFILEDNTIQPFVTIGNNVTLWSGNHIGHDSTIADHCFISSHVVISGHCTIGAYAFLGVNATLHNSIQIAERCLIGAGAVIMKDTVAKGVYLPKQGAMLFAKNSDEVEL
jgi:sugar O-acyltransferase (sialic acid O-acetyltransferase NeuD family)